jgi:type IV pilus assembly protein PilA
VNTISKRSLQTLPFFLRHARSSKVLARQRGQGMTEYIIIVALVAVAAIGVYQYFGQVMRSQTAAVAKELAGEDGTAQTKAAKTAAQGASAQTKAKSLKGFTGNASAAKR